MQVEQEPDEVESPSGYPGKEEVKKAVRLAAIGFWESDRELLSRRTHEVSLTSALACHLRQACKVWAERGWPGWSVDCEYNRIGGHLDPKRVKYLDSTQVKGDLVRPDIVIHKRGVQENLIALEAKPFDGDPDNDHKKIRGYIRELRYLYGISLSFPSPTDRSGVFSGRWFELDGGNLIEQMFLVDAQASE